MKQSQLSWQLHFGVMESWLIETAIYSTLVEIVCVSFNSHVRESMI